jgi:hypothetical protein
MNHDLPLLYEAVKPYLRPSAEAEHVRAALGHVIACPVCARPRKLTCAVCRGRMGGARSTPLKTAKVRENIKRASAVRWADKDTKPKRKATPAS